MERQSDKHGPRVDESMKRQAGAITRGAPGDSRAGESREPEAPADGEANADAVLATTEEGTGSLTRQEVELRQDLARFLEREIFPATRDDIVKDAAGMGAPDHVIAWFKRLPDRTYEGFPQIWETGSGHTEPRQI